MVEVRDVRPEDADGIVAILNPIVKARIYTAFDAPFTADTEREYILKFPRRGIGLIVKEHSRSLQDVAGRRRSRRNEPLLKFPDASQSLGTTLQGDPCAHLPRSRRSS